MSSTDLPPTRSAPGLCGAVSFVPMDAPSGHGACHCGMCRRGRGGIEPGAMTTEARGAGRRAEHVRIHGSPDRAERAFCGTCGAHLCRKRTADGSHKGMMSLSAGALDNPDGMILAHEVYIDMKPAGHALAGDRTRMTEAEVPAMAGAEPEGETP